jgi:hypothetical protein
MTIRRPRRRRSAPELPPGPEDWAVAEEDEPHLTRVEGPSELSGELARLQRRRGWGERLGAARLDAAWEEIVGAELTAHCEPVRLAGGVLVIRAATPVWATQLRYLTVGLVERAQAVLGAGSVRDVSIVVGRLEGRHGTGTGAGVLRAPDGTDVRHTAAEDHEGRGPEDRPEAAR